MCSTCKWRENSFGGQESIKLSNACPEGDQTCLDGQVACETVRSRIENRDDDNIKAGNFRSCRKMYDIGNNTASGSACLATFSEYIEHNPNDTARIDAYNIAMDPESTEGEYMKALEELDYFVYSICEEPCDCIDWGSHRSIGKSITAESAITDTYSIARGNCFAHAFFDICRVFPNMVDIQAVNAEARNQTSSCHINLCGSLNNMRKANKNWKEQSVDFSTAETDCELRQVRDFLTNYLEDLGRSGDLYDQCWDLECAQDRISTQEG